MSVKSDRWIKSKCMPPTHVITQVCGVPGDHFGHEMKPEDLPRQEVVVLSTDAKIQEYLDNDTMGTIVDVRRTTAEEKAAFEPMIFPFEPGNIRHVEGQKILSYGTSSFGYDVTLSDEFKIFTNLNSGIIDPLNFDEKCLHEFKGDVCILPPNSYILGVTREKFKIPRNVMVVCVGKSTYARCGAIVNVTPIEPGFEGHVVIEISNATTLPMKIYANQGIAQFIFFESDEECETSYADKNGKYQGQSGITLAKG